MNIIRNEAQFLACLADIFLKIFQIVFALLVVGMFVRDRFELVVFIIGIMVSFGCLTMTVVFYYNAYVGGNER